MNPATSADALKSITDFSNTRKNANDYLNDAYGKYGVTDAQTRASGLRSSINNTQNLLDAVPDSVSGRTSGSLVTDAARSRLVAMEQAPISKQLGSLNSAYDLANSDYKDALGQAQTFSTNAYTGDTDKLGALKSVYDGLVAKEAADRQQAEAERQYQEWLQQFTESKRQFDVDQANKQAQAAAAARATTLAGLASANATAAASKAATAQSQQNAAYSSVQGFLKQGRQAAESDFYATYQSAMRGNALDKLKVALYQQAGIGVSGVKQSGGSITSGSASF